MDNSLSKKYGRTTGIINDGVSIYLSKGVSVFLSAIVRGFGVDSGALEKSFNIKSDGRP
jgi:hypothetical protein